MKKLFFISVSALLSAVLFTAPVSAQRNEPFTTHNFGALVMSSINVVETSMINGSITLSGIDGSEAIVEMYVSGNNPSSRQWSDEQIRQELEASYTIEVKLEGEKLLIEARPKGNNREQRLNVSFVVKAPKRVTGNLQTTNGSIAVSNLSGAQNIRSTNGSLNIEDVSGKISGRTTNGSINLSNSSNETEITSTNGNISAKDCKGKITMRTTNGGVRLSDISGVVSATSTNGSITARYINGELTMQTSNGSVNLYDVSGNVDARTTNSSVTATINAVSEFVKLSTSRGNVNLTLPAGAGYDLNVRANNISTTGLRGFSGNTQEKRMEGTVDGGGAKIEVNTAQRANLTFR